MLPAHAYFQTKLFECSHGLTRALISPDTVSQVSNVHGYRLCAYDNSEALEVFIQGKVNGNTSLYTSQQHQTVV